MRFQERLKELRTEKGWTQKALAQKLSVSDDCVFFWEKGRSEPSLQQVLDLAELFDVTTDFLLGRVDY